MASRMSLDVSLMGVDDLTTIPALAGAADTRGFDGIWSSEVNHDPFLQLALAATASKRLVLGTSIALGFTRSPMTLAYTCWDLAALTRGRFILGLGTQVKAHIERRFGLKWEPPLARLREVVEGLRAIWASWRGSERLNFRGKHYQFTLMTPFFTPPRHEFDIPITIAGVNPGLCELAGELCDGFHIHPLHSVQYLTQSVRPAIIRGAQNTNRSIDDLTLIAAVFVVTGEDARQTDLCRESVRQQISFYASTPSYRLILETHGWEGVAEQLSRLAARKQWNEMPKLITDEMLDTFAVVADPNDVGPAVLGRYAGLVDRVSFYLPFRPGTLDNLWTSAIHAFASQP